MSHYCSLLLLILSLALGPRSGCAAIGEIKSGPLQVQASISGAVTYLEPLECYVESADRSGGIRVLGSTTGLAIGSLVTATGVYDVIDGEPCVKNATITPQTGSANISPFGMPNAAITGPLTWLRVQDYKRTPAPGGWTYEWVRAAGAANTGLLVKTWGKVNALYYSPVNLARWFYLDDGYSAVSDYGNMGVLVYSDAEVKRGDVVSVTGISTVEPSFEDGMRLARAIRTRSASDVQIERPGPTQGPFSDEFNGPKLESWWAFLVYPYGDAPTSFSLSSEPGWVALTAQPMSSTARCWSQLMQLAPGAWECNTKVQLAFAELPYVNQSLSLTLDGSLPKPNNPGGGGYYCSDRTVFASASCSWSVDHCEKRVFLGTTREIPMEGDTCYFRIRRTGIYGAYMYGSVSFDGLSYTDEYIGKDNGWHFLTLVTRASDSSGGGAPFTAYIDYIRFTRIQ